MVQQTSPSVDLSSLRRALNGTRLGERPATALFERLPPALSAQVNRLLRGQRLTVEEFFDSDEYPPLVAELLPASHGLVKTLRLWLASQGVHPDPEPPPNPLGDPASRLSAAIEALKVPGIEDWRLDFFLPGHSATPLKRAAAAIDPAIFEALLRSLSRWTAGLDAARAALPDDFVGTLPPVDDAILQTFRRQLARARLPTLHTWPPDLFTVMSRLLSAKTLKVSVRGPIELEPAVIEGDPSGWADLAQFVCSCGRSGCMHVLLGLDALLSWTSRLEQPEASLVRLTCERPWQRLSRALELAPGPVAAEKPRELMVRINMFEPQFSTRLPAGARAASPWKHVRDYREILPSLTGLDRRIIEQLLICVEPQHLQFRGLPGEVALLLVGHPRVFLGLSQLPSTVELATPEAVVDETEAGLRLGVRLAGVPVDATSRFFGSARGRVAGVVASPNRWVLGVLPAAIDHLVAHLRQHGDELPREATPSLVKWLQRAESEAQVELPPHLRGLEVQPARRMVALVTSGRGLLSLQLKAEPLEGGPLFTPGHGAPVSAAFDGQRRTFTRRDFEGELRAAAEVVGRLALDAADDDGPFTWSVVDQDLAVECLRRLSLDEGDDLRVEWPAKRPTFRPAFDLSRLRLAVTPQRDWFGLEGEALVDGARITLAELLEAARLRRRWVRVGQDDYVTLSESLLERVAPLAAVTEGPETALTLGLAPLVAELAAGVASFEAHTDFQRLMTRLADTRERAYPMPRAVKTPLRDYQQEGVRWLLRLADWGAGACLADDMGLGKTLQAIAVLCARLKDGPALVVAPSSVLATWKNEAARHAPSLPVALLHEGSVELDSLKRRQVVVVSWSTLARRAEQFAQVQWGTVVLDEAHAIKNANTQRARAAHGLKADFLIALTGTPIENHLGELWSLMRAVMPSLLGSEEAFSRRFGSHSPDAVKALSTLVRPFILRRSKAAVATELPARTDLDVLVPLSDEEKALYDDVRLAAVNQLAEGNGRDARFEVFAALTRLRQTACHPRLVDEGWKGPTSKLTRLLELLEDLREGDHRVLVFSQFTRHLALVQDALNEKGIAFSYLDGHTSLADRAARVEAFQKGEGGDVFLISLKAGGTGLTLTAADYVIHLDPWWNPAVEDQASDRAHRLGQTKPVTVYRLIAEGTIEQQIVSMHDEKRELVDALLEGTDAAGKLSTKELADLIRRPITA